jgi:hypothetical protein
MITFQPFVPGDREKYAPYLALAQNRGCEYSFANLCMWGRQQGAILEEGLVFFSQFSRKTVYLFPLGANRKALVGRLMEDAKERGIPLRLTGLLAEDCQELESLFPGRFRFHNARSDYDYIYNVEDLANLKGKAYQSKRNFANRFQKNQPNAKVVPIGEENREAVEQMLDTWFADRRVKDPQGDYHMEKAALQKALSHMEELGLEGVALMEGNRALAMTVGSRLAEDTFDVHFEKALDTEEGAYARINQAFAGYLMEKYPVLRYLNREDDMGLEGLRKAKLSYHPVCLIEKYWACLKDECYDY